MIITTITVTTMTEPITLSLVHVWGKKTGIVSVCLKSLSRVLKNHQMQMYQMKYMYACALHVYHSFSNFHARVRQHTCWRLHTYIHVCTMLQSTYTTYMYNIQVEHRQYMQNTSVNRWSSYYCGYHATQCMVRWVVPQCLCIHTHTHKNTHAHTHMHTHTRTHTHTHAHTHSTSSRLLHEGYTNKVKM